ncbi:MAG: flavodoxin family protein [Muribaculaceae bacterium]|nr:flavodoxin family protein [Muribaculaceae bacterium]
MKVLGINGSARKGWNTQTLVRKALEGAASMGAETELIDLYAEPLKGCLECFACKRKGNKTGGICAIRDNMRPLLEKAHDADVVIIGSPNFFGYPSAMTRAFLERFLYPLTSYQLENGQRVRLLGNRIIPAALIFTMNADDEAYDKMGYGISLGATKSSLEYVLGYAEQYNSYMTLQFKDYAVMDANMFDPEARLYRHQTQFPIDAKECFELGQRLVAKAKEFQSVASV